MYLLGLDLGTTGCKSIIFNPEGGIVSQAYIEYSLIYTPEGYIEQDADLWWRLAKEAIKEAILKSGIAPGEITALSVSSQGIAFVPVDESGNTLGNAISWLDTRAGGETCQIRDIFGEREIFERTGKRLNQAYSLPKMMWLKKNRPDIYKKAWKLLMGLDYLTYKLTGIAVTDHSMASGTMAYSISKGDWDREILRLCGIDINKLPEVRFLGSTVGPVLPDAAREAGLSEKTTVILGAQDQKCAAVGAGINEGICTVSLGTATAITSMRNKPMLDRHMRIPCFTLDEGRWVLEAVLTTSGVGLKWLKNTFFSDKSYREIDEAVESVPPGSGRVFFLPHMEGASSPHWKPTAKGLIYGLGLSTSANEILRSLYEGVAFQIRENIGVLEEMGQDIRELRVFGGGAKSGVWCRIIADVTGKDVSILCTNEAANLGAAVIAGTGSGIYGGFEDLLSRIKIIEKTYKPGKEAAEIYRKAYLEYREIQNKILG
ncbi:xylulokinase [Anaerobacterium chartisolvens]|uniref:Xylulokinase n=1 Tax=Anaerobacterium chartisolvens TaxID=1297424 RepID=A0A369BEJ2_9FIRM|nr:FGGY family carbohydrate kinase [Anaerobacterium chartisolvens]RCX19980.1 xylulokinase [Anaerobacterium chartisolvens]